MASSDTCCGCGFPVDKESRYDEHRQLMYNQVIARDEKRFWGADRDGDQKLNREEYADFLHPGNKVYQCTLIVYWPEPHTSIHSP